MIPCQNLAIDGSSCMKLRSLCGRPQKGRKVKVSAGGRRYGVPYRDPPATDLVALHALVFPLPLPFRHLPRRLEVTLMLKVALYSILQS